MVTNNAYLLFYAKTSVDYFMRQTLSAPNLWPHIVKFQENIQRQGTEKTKVLMRKQSSTGFRENYRFNKVSSKVLNESPDCKKKVKEEESFIKNLIINCLILIKKERLTEAWE